MDIKELGLRISYVRNKANFSARELSQMIGKSDQYISHVEHGRIKISVEILSLILEVCEFPEERIFSKNIYDYDIDNELLSLIQSLPTSKKQNIIEFIKK